MNLSVAIALVTISVVGSWSCPAAASGGALHGLLQETLELLVGLLQLAAFERRQLDMGIPLETIHSAEEVARLD
jgi:hypothetical protein